MNEPFSFALFATLMGMVLVWFVLLKLLVNRLEQAHPQKYAAMGRPSLFWRNSPSASLAVLNFLIVREHRALNDSYLSKLSNLMLILLVVYVVLFVGLFVLNIGQCAL